MKKRQPIKINKYKNQVHGLGKKTKSVNVSHKAMRGGTRF